MGRSWSTFNAPPQWGKLTGIPTDFSDGQIDWTEIKNKPFGSSNLFNNANRGITIMDDAGDGTPIVELKRGKSGFTQAPLLVLDFAWEDDANYNARIAMDSSRFYIDMKSTHRFCIAGISNSPIGLPTYAVWRDSAGYLRIV